MYASYRNLLASVLLHAIKDWQRLQECDNRRFVDDDHKKICQNTRGRLGKWHFATGKEELEYFFNSLIFYDLCAELGLDANDVREKIGIPS